MRPLFFILFFFSMLVPAQELEDMQEGYFYSENTKNYFRVDIAKPFDYYKVNSCTDQAAFVRAQFDGGDAAFNRELFRYISAYIDREIYVVNGTFYLNVSISKNGEITGLDIVPKVPNSEMFLQDLKFAVLKIKRRWTPSTCVGVPVDSRIRIKLNFVTESVDV